MTGPRDIQPLPPHSPWASWARPDLQHCEANLDGWITTPANTWTNLAYLVAAWYLWRKGEKEFAFAAAAMGVTSFLFHASFTFFFQFFDYVGMFIYLGIMLSLNARRLGRTLPSWGVVLGCCAATFAFRALGVGIQWIVVALVLGVFSSEVAARGKGYKDFAVAALFMAGAVACWLLDYKRIWCDPDNHWLQGHGTWHVLSAAAIPYVARFYRNNSVTR